MTDMTPQWDRFPFPWLKLLSEGLELALKEKTYTDKYEINLTLESLRRNRNARENSAAIPEPAITKELWNGIGEVGRLRRVWSFFYPRLNCELDQIGRWCGMLETRLRLRKTTGRSARFNRRFE
jgi:hypothetical protein